MEDTGNAVEDTASTDDINLMAKTRPRAKKRRRIESDSGTESDEGLPENAFEVEKNVIASAMKNNLDDVSVKKILKKVVTNDHVLALVKLREEEEACTEESKLIPKLTRSKVKELTKVSRKSAPWNLQNLELTPIKHIPVKTTPEVTALIAQELPDDEDDDEYKPYHESDDEHGLESCSDLDSQPRTPATPGSQQKASPQVVKDGPFKVPQDVPTPTRRKLDMAEEATIARRTRSKLCLSETPIEHIESSFVPPDELPVPVDDHLWNDFLTECLNPASVSKNEDDDETDPEYNVAADPDAPDDDDEDALERSIIKISKKELNDLVTELFNIMPEASVDDELAKMANGVLADETNNKTPPRWEGKQEPVSEDESSVKMVDRIVFERRSSISKFSVGKMEPAEYEEYESETVHQKEKENNAPEPRKGAGDVVDIRVEERPAAPAPPALARLLRGGAHRLRVTLDRDRDTFLPEQVPILQQQLRQHVQLATSNFLQLFVHPVHWALGPTYKEYIESLVKMVEAKPDSVVNVCNLKPAMELCQTWEESVSEDTPENKKMVEFILNETERCQRRIANNNLYVGDFHETFLRTVANSSVFLYPYLLPAMPYRAVTSKRFSYLPSEDALLAIGLDQFWDYVDNNPDIYKKPQNPRIRHRWGLSFVVALIAKHMFPWLTPKVLMAHIMKARAWDKDNPIYRFFHNRTVEPYRHRLLPYNPSITLYEQPEHEMPKIWVRFLAKTSRRFRSYLYRSRSVRSTFSGEAPAGVEVGLPLAPPPKPPLPIDFTKQITCWRINSRDPKPPTTDKFNVQVKLPTTDTTPPAFYRLIKTTIGINLVPLKVVRTMSPDGPVVTGVTNTVDCNVTPISSTVEFTNEVTRKNYSQTDMASIESRKGDHCNCCVLLGSICKKQTMITDYFRSGRERSKPCRCKERRWPKVSNRLRLLVDRYKQRQECVYRDLTKKLEPGLEAKKNSKHKNEDEFDCDAERMTFNVEDEAIITTYQIKLTLRSLISKHVNIKRRVSQLFSNFDLDTDDPVTLANRLEQSFQADLVDLHKEFIGFLTAEQADRMGRFRDYFTLNCVEGLMGMVEKHVRDPTIRKSILEQLRRFFCGAWSACSMCAELLRLMHAHPDLAEYTFSLFPHKAYEKNLEETTNDVKATGPMMLNEPMDEEASGDLLANGEVSCPPNYEADHSSSSEEEYERESLLVPRGCLEKDETPPKRILVSLDSVLGSHQIPFKTEPPDDSSDMSMMIMSDEEYIKAEPPESDRDDDKDDPHEGGQNIQADPPKWPSRDENLTTKLEWKREEDKLILEVLKVNLTPEERKDKTIMEILEEKQVVEVLSQSLVNKSVAAVKERVLYIMNVLLLGET